MTAESGFVLADISHMVSLQIHRTKCEIMLDASAQLIHRQTTIKIQTTSFFAEMQMQIFSTRCRLNPSNHLKEAVCVDFVAAPL